jgi:hypothetical protein
VELEIRKDDGNTIMVVQKQGSSRFYCRPARGDCQQRPSGDRFSAVMLSGGVICERRRFEPFAGFFILACFTIQSAFDNARDAVTVAGRLCGLNKKAMARLIRLLTPA